MQKQYSNFNSLVGALSAEDYKDGKLSESCDEMKETGYEGVYFNNIFFRIIPEVSDSENIIFREDDASLLYRSMEELEKIKNIVLASGLEIPSSHFLQMVPPPGIEPEWIFPIHKRLLEMAGFLGIKMITTHLGWMFGTANAQYNGENVLKFKNGEISYFELCRKINENYNIDKLYDDSVCIYRNLCRMASEKGISITIETACSESICMEHPEKTFSGDIDKITCFIGDVKENNLGICVDSGHCHWNGFDVADVIRKSDGLFWETHFHDNYADRDRHNPVGIGTVNWMEVIRAMKDVNYKGSVTFEQSDYITNANNWRLFLKESI